MNQIFSLQIWKLLSIFVSLVSVFFMKSFSRPQQLKVARRPQARKL